jgi:hypothetical protein
MADMSQSSYWYEYLRARHDTFRDMGIVLIAATLISMVTGRTLVKYHGIVRRAENPKSFWQSVAVYCVLGLFCLELYFLTFH